MNRSGEKKSALASLMSTLYDRMVKEHKVRLEEELARARLEGSSADPLSLAPTYATMLDKQGIKKKSPNKLAVRRRPANGLSSTQKMVARDAFRQLNAISTPPQLREVQHSRFVSEIRQNANKRCFPSHERFMAYNDMAEMQRMTGHSSLGFWRSNSERTKLQGRRGKKKDWDNMNMRDMRKALLLSSRERQLVKLPRL